MSKIFKKVLRGGNDNLVAELETLKFDQENLEKKLSEEKNVTALLRHSYQESKGTFPPIRYGKLKTMIKKATNDSRVLETNPLTENTRINQSEYNVGSFCESTLSLLDHMQQKARTSKDIKKDVEFTRNRVTELRMEWLREKRKFVTLDDKYQYSKRSNPFRRYTEMKEMTKEAVREQLNVEYNLKRQANIISMARQSFQRNSMRNSFQRENSFRKKNTEE